MQPITTIRNNAAFHYHDEQDLAEQEFHKIPESEPWDVYLSNVGNSFYYVSELVMAGLVINLAKKNPDDSTPYIESASKGFERLCRMVIGVAERT